MTSVEPLLTPIRTRLEAVSAKTVHNPMFGDVLRIVWTTYYFGADLKWHNARSGDIEDPETLAAEQEAAEGDWAWLTPASAPTDMARLLGAVEAALKLAEEWRYKGEFGWGPWQEGYGPDHEGYVLDQAAAELRAAVTTTLGGDK